MDELGVVEKGQVMRDRQNAEIFGLHNTPFNYDERIGRRSFTSECGPTKNRLGQKRLVTDYRDRIDFRAGVRDGGVVGESSSQTINASLLHQ